MRRLRVLIAAMAVSIVMAGCASDGGTASDTRAASQTTAAPTSTTAAPATEADFDRGNFSNSARIDNEWLPLRPGTRWIWDGQAIVDGERTRRRIVFTVTDLTKTIDGVRTAVVWDRDYNGDELIESEIAFLAQDDDGNVWHLGQYPEEYEEGKLDATPAWISGMEGAKPGISMRADPRTGTSDYSQGFAPKVPWTDRAKVYQIGQKTCVLAGCYEDVLVIDESDREEPDAHQLKYYARGVGNIRVGWRGRDEEKEVLMLSRVVRLDARARAEARKEALALDRRAYVNSKAVYGRTSPAA